MSLLSVNGKVVCVSSLWIALWYIPKMAAPMCSAGSRLQVTGTLGSRGERLVLLWGDDQGVGFVRFGCRSVTTDSVGGLQPKSSAVGPCLKLRFRTLDVYVQSAQCAVPILSLKLRLLHFIYSIYYFMVVQICVTVSYVTIPQRKRIRAETEQM